MIINNHELTMLEITEILEFILCALTDDMHKYENTYTLDDKNEQITYARAIQVCAAIVAINKGTVISPDSQPMIVLASTDARYRTLCLGMLLRILDDNIDYYANANPTYTTTKGTTLPFAECHTILYEILPTFFK